MHHSGESEVAELGQVRGQLAANPHDVDHITCFHACQTSRDAVKLC